MAGSPNAHSNAAERKMKHSAARLSIIVALFLIALKGTSGWLTRRR